MSHSVLKSILNNTALIFPLIVNAVLGVLNWVETLDWRCNRTRTVLRSPLGLKITLFSMF